MSAPRMHVLPMGATQLEERVMAEHHASEQRILDEALSAPTISVRVTDRRMTLGQIMELAAPLVAIGYAVQLDWITDDTHDIIGVTLHGVKAVAQNGLAR